LHVILSMVDRREVTIEVDHSLPTESAGGFRTGSVELGISRGSEPGT